MLKLIKYLKPYVWIIAAIFALLYGQAMTELALPEYLSRIVNIGIQQSGVRNAAPVAVRAGELDKIRLFMSDSDIADVNNSYILLDKQNLSEEDYNADVGIYPALADEPIYKLNTNGKPEIEKLNSIFTVPLMIVSKIKQDNIADLTGGVRAFPPDTDPFEYFANLPAAERGNILKTIKSKLALIPGNSVAQSAIGYTVAEYKAIGMDLGKEQNSYILNTGSIMLVLSLLGTAASIIVGYFSARVSAGFGRTIRRKLFVKIENFSNIEFNKFTTASLITRSTNDIQQIQFVLMMTLRAVFYSPIMGIGAIIKAMSEDASMLWLIAAAVGFMLLLIFTQFSLTIPKFKIVQKLVDKLNLVTRQILTGLMVIRAFNTRKHEEKKFDKANAELTRTNLFIHYIMIFMMPGMMLIMNGVMLAIIWFGAGQIDTGNMQVGSMMAFMQYTMQVIMSFMMVSMTFMMLPRANVSGERIADVLETEISIMDPEKPKKYDLDFKGQIEFHDVSFKYPDADDYVLRNISFTALPGRTTAFIGSTGSGKSTLVNLILRFYDVTDGRILIDKTDIRDVTQHDLRKNIGYIPQKTVLFSGTIETNIKYGDENAPETDVYKSAEISQALEFIKSNEDGFQMDIAQAGLNLSGGQKQRLSIARALAKKPAILIFDDSFSALDFTTDAALRRALKKEIDNLTVLIVAQRISTIMNAEQIVVLNEGIVTGIGTHRELMESCEEYRELALSQLTKEELA